MTDTSTEAVAALMDRVTEGPWQVGSRHVPNGVFSSKGDIVANTHSAHRNFRRDDQIAEQDANCRFIVASRNLVPALAAERDALRAQVQTARAGLERIEASDIGQAGRDACAILALLDTPAPPAITPIKE